MRRFVTEVELLTVDLRGYCEALLLSDPNDTAGILVYDFRQLAPFSSTQGKGTPVANQLLILVDGEADEEALRRVAATLSARAGHV